MPDETVQGTEAQTTGAELDATAEATTSDDSINESLMSMLGGDDGDVHQDSPSIAAEPGAVPPTAPAPAAHAEKEQPLTAADIERIVSERVERAVADRIKAHPAPSAEPTDAEIGLKSIEEFEKKLISIGVDEDAAKKQAPIDREEHRAILKRLYAQEARNKVEAAEKEHSQFVGTVGRALSSLPDFEQHYGKDGARTKEHEATFGQVAMLAKIIASGARAEGLTNAQADEIAKYAHYAVTGARKSATPATQPEVKTPPRRAEPQKRAPSLRLAPAETDAEQQAQDINANILNMARTAGVA